MQYRVLVADNCFGTEEEARRILSEYDMKAYFCGGDGAEVLKRIEELKPDAVVMNVILRDSDAFDVLSRACGEAGSPKFIVTYCELDAKSVEKVMELGASYCVELPIDRHLLASRLDLLHRIAEYSPSAVKPARTAEEEIADVLHKLAVPAHIKGYQYLREAILLSLRSQTPVSFVTKEIYPTVARRFGTTVSRVERAIRNAIELTWDRGDVEVLTGYFGYTVRADRGKPTNREFISTVTERLRLSFVR